MSAPLSCVYALTDPADGKIYYVGQTSHLSRRISFLLYRQHSQPLRTWVRRLKQEHRRPRVVILQHCSREALVPAERRWIGYYLARHEPLLNTFIPRPPRQLRFVFDPFTTIIWSCVNCRKTWATYGRTSGTKTPRYCWHCGQQLRWELPQKKEGPRP
jgi:hypothetical protein